MKELCGKFMKILKIELEDLKEDVLLLEELYKEREKKGEITRYVRLENSGLLEHEIAGIQHLMNSLDALTLDGCADLEALVERVDEHMKRKNQEADFPDVVYHLSRKRLHRVHKYIEGV